MPEDKYFIILCNSILGCSVNTSYVKKKKVPKGLNKASNFAKIDNYLVVNNSLLDIPAEEAGPLYCPREKQAVKVF